MAAEIRAGSVDVAATQHSAEGLWVAAGLRRDFEAAGINLPADRRDAADKLTAGIERLRMLIGQLHSCIQHCRSPNTADRTDAPPPPPLPPAPRAVIPLSCGSFA